MDDDVSACASRLVFVALFRVTGTKAQTNLLPTASIARSPVAIRAVFAGLLNYASNERGTESW